MPKSKKSKKTIYPLTLEGVRKLTNKIRKNVGTCRNLVLRMANEKGWELMGYHSFHEWAQKEFDVVWQQVYNYKAAAQFDAELSQHSPTGKIYQIPVNHARQLRKLDSSAMRVRAYQLAETMSIAQGKASPTEELVRKAIEIVRDENRHRGE